MEKTWRWFGPNDKITLDMLRQIGVEGIVTSLHHIPNGEVWSYEEIMKMKNLIESHGMRWSVVESLPVSESIKYGGADRPQLIENYKESLANLGKAGVKTICYNFMPVLDWARTDLEYPNGDGTSNLYFNKAEFAYFDCCILKREGAEKDYDAATLARLEELKKSMTPEGERRLVDNIIVKTQGFVNGNISEDDTTPVDTFRELLKLYDGIDRDKLRANMKYFLEAIMPVCREYDINMCVHPDDPPLQILGLPRIVTCDEDIEWFLNAVPDSHNGLTFCAGSLSAGAHNDVPALAKKYADRTHFVHARICNVLPDGDFKESTHLDPRLIDVINTFETRRPGVPMRVDHAPLMLGDDKMGYNAGYSFHGRMLALGMVSGIMAAVNNLK
ncbi:mannonate dehydratase [Barnesiella sp. WM24]|uniref:mannonate dehydratase n=1 Tax=Barnesiella sp. WM24 TaxID=2558278 RepID=UPI001071F171|nr:mannonate dehydratase [Barnesiella sp. WM24]TFU94977.1 mannonate dehydratase [Barnesiella sp. WM24]